MWYFVTAFAAFILGFFSCSVLVISSRETRYEEMGEKE